MRHHDWRKRLAILRRRGKGLEKKKGEYDKFNMHEKKV